MPEMVLRLLDKLTTDAVYSMRPAERRRFADQCRHWADVAARADLPATGYALQPRATFYASIAGHAQCNGGPVNDN